MQIWFWPISWTVLTDFVWKIVDENKRWFFHLVTGSFVCQNIVLVLYFSTFLFLKIPFTERLLYVAFSKTFLIQPRSHTFHFKRGEYRELFSGRNSGAAARKKPITICLRSDICIALFRLRHWFFCIFRC